MVAVIGFIVGAAAFFIGIILGANLAGCIAYREGVEDTKKGNYIHARCWHHNKEEFE